MNKLICTLLSLVLTLSLVNMKITKVEGRESRYDRWHYRYETDNGEYSFGETHPTSIDLPERYDSRDYGYVTSMKNQGNTGLCWIFGSIGAMEININKKGLNETGEELDLSEAHLGYFYLSSSPNELNLNPEDGIVPHSEYTFINHGGSALLASFALARGIGPVSESVAPFEPYSYSFVNNIPKDSQYQREYTLKDSYHPMIDDVEYIKRLVYSQGSATVAYVAEDNNSWKQYVNSYGMSNHIIHIIGYDDTIPKEMFDPVARIDGAWIVKNSWGTTSNGGVFYLSYDAGSLEVTVPNMVDKEAYDYNYYYQASSHNERYESEAGQAITIANVYEAKNSNITQKEVLHSIGVALAGINTEYELQIYLDPEDGKPDSGTPVYNEPLMGSIVQRGYYTICLPESIELDKGQKFSIVLRLQNRNLNYRTMYYLFNGGPCTTYDIYEQTMENQSFIKKGNNNWEDLHDISKTVMIHGLTNVVDQSYEPSKELKQEDFSISQTVYDYTNDAIEPILTINNKELKEMIDYSIRYEDNIELGTGKVIVFGMNDYEGSQVEYEFTIEKAKLSQDGFETISDQYSNGTQLRPELEIYYYDLLLEEGKDYIAYYGENIYDNGTLTDGTVRIEGIGNFEGTLTNTFNIIDPDRLISMSSDVYPRDYGSAVTPSIVEYGHSFLVAAGYYSSGTSFIRWLVNGIDYGRSEDMNVTAYDSMHFTALFTDVQKTLQDLVNLYEEYKDIEETGYEVRWNNFVSELNKAKALYDKVETNINYITQQYVYLEEAYKMLEVELDLSDAYKALDSIKDYNENEYHYKSWGTLMYRKDLLEKAMSDINMTQDKLDLTIEEFIKARDGLLSDHSDPKTSLTKLYESKLLLNKDLYTLDSYNELLEVLDRVKLVIDNDNASNEDISNAYNQLSQVILIERGNPELLISLINECSLIDKNNYTDDSYNTFKTVLNESIEFIQNTDNYSQIEIDHMYDKLYNAKTNLKGITIVNKEQLKQTLELYKDIDISLYNNTEQFKEAYSYAVDIYESSTSQDEVDTANQRLIQAYTLLIIKVDKTELSSTIAKALSIDLFNKTNKSIEVFNNALDYAQEVYEDENSTTDTVLKAIEDLTNAMNSLEFIQYKDVTEDAWYYTYVIEANKLGLMTGVSDGTYFKPDIPLTRAMAITVLYRLEDREDVDYKPVLSDVRNNEWYTKQIMWAYENNVAKGYLSGKFGPDDYVKRQDLAVMIYNYAKSTGMNVSTSSDLKSFKDYKDVDLYAIEALIWCVENGIMSGSHKEDGVYLKPQLSASRAEASKMFVNFYKL